MTALKGARLRELRKLNKISLRAASDILGCSAGHLCELENNSKDPDAYALLVRMARMYGVSTDYLLGLDDEGSDALTMRDRAVVGLLEDILRITRHNELEQLLDSGSPAFASAVADLLGLDEDPDVGIEVMQEAGLTQ